MERSCISIFDINIDIININGLLNQVQKYLYARGKKVVMYANVHTLNLANKDKEYKSILNSADLVYCDGGGVRIGASILGKYLPERMTGADWIWDFADMCSQNGYSLYLLGGDRGVAEHAAEKLREKYQNLNIAGLHHGYFMKRGNENDNVINIINQKKPDILLVGFGSPLQEKWINENFKNINSSVLWAVGAMMDFVSGKTRRGPQWMLENNMEWLYRLIIEPRRLWRRYIIGNIYFYLKIIKIKYNSLP